MSDDSFSDSLFAKPRRNLVDFVFDAEVASVFPDMIRRSVPGYETILSHLGVFAEVFSQPQSNIYDLGCSLGASTLSMVSRLSRSDRIKVISVDNAPAMVQQCESNLAKTEWSSLIDVRCEDINDTVIERASLVVMNFTLQFVPLEKRHALIHRIYEGLIPGGALVLSEKLTREDETDREFMIGLHQAFKRANGYSDLEIAQKRSALENVLVPETANDHFQRLQECGFAHVDQWFQCFNFASFVAVK